MNGCPNPNPNTNTNPIILFNYLTHTSTMLIDMPYAITSIARLLIYGLEAKNFALSTNPIDVVPFVIN